MTSLEEQLEREEIYTNHLQSQSTLVSVTETTATTTTTTTIVASTVVGFNVATGSIGA